MTVIAWDGKTLAADKLCSNGGTINSVTKIHKINGVLCGGSGEMAFVNNMVEWVRDGRVPSEFPESQKDKDNWQPFLVIELDGTISMYDRTFHPIRYEQQHAAIGSGREYARAAMHLGHTAQEAVLCAMALDVNCGVGIDELTLYETPATSQVPGDQRGDR